MFGCHVGWMQLMVYFLELVLFNYYCFFRRQNMLDVLTSLSDCRQESAERWNGDFGGFVYVLDRFPQRDFGLWVLYARLISVSFSGSLLQRRLPRPTALFSGYHAEGYHARTDAIKLTGYHVCRVTTPELPRSKQTSGYRQVITPAGSF